jgi:hypothetical protein
MKKILKTQVMNRDARVSRPGMESFEIKKGDLLVKDGASIFKVEAKDIHKFMDKKEHKNKSGFWNHYEETIKDEE